MSAQLNPSRYPPGFSLVLAPFVYFGTHGVSDAQRGATVVAIVALLAIVAAAWALGGAIAAGIAALATRASPFVETSARLVMSDAFGALLAVAAVALMACIAMRRLGRRGRDALVVAAGACAGYGVITRMSAGFMVAALAAAVRSWRERVLVLVAALPFVLFLAGYQWTIFGHPLRSGYDYYLPKLQLFDAANITEQNLFGERGFIFDDKLHGALMRWTCPCDEAGPIGKASNLVFYPAVLLGLYWIYYPPLFSVLGAIELWRRRTTVAARFAMLLIAANVGLMLPFFYQGGRFVAPAAFVLLAYSAAGAARLLEGAITRASRGADAASGAPSRVAAAL